MAESILRSLDKELLKGLKEILESRDGARKKNSPMFMTAADIENKNPQFGAAFNQSYKRIPANKPIARSNTFDKIARENINTHYVSSQFGLSVAKKPYEEGTRKLEKVQFEEELFKAEDERFEMDVNIHRFRHVVKWLEMLGDKDITEERSEALIEKML